MPDKPVEASDAAEQSRAKAYQLFQQARGLATEADRVALPAEAIALRKRATALYQEATQLQPDFAPAYRLWATSLLELAARSQDAAQQRANVQSALERGAAADQCASAEWEGIRQWATMLVAQVATLAPDPSDRLVILAAACKSFERSLEKVSFASQRPPIELELADCLYRLSSLTTDPAAQRALYEQVIARVNSAATAKPELITGPVDDLWGSVCLELGKLAKDTAVLRQAVVHLSRGVEATRDLGSRYNLVCTYALLGERDAALQQLRLCLENDQGKFREMATADLDLASLRKTPEFTELLNAKPAGLDAVEVFRKGQDAQQLAEDAKADSDALKHFEEAVQFYAKAVEVRPNFAEAHGRWARCLFGMARRTTDPQEHNRLVTAALARFDAAAKCPDVTFQTHNFAGSDILSEAAHPGQESGRKRALLQSARENFEAGLKLTESDSDRRALERPLALCLTSLAGVTNDIKEKRALLAQAIALFESTAPKVGDQTDASVLASWGLAFLQLGELDRDPSTLRQSIERLSAAVERKTDSPGERYNLACAYALLNQPDQAVRHLRFCWEKTPEGVFRRMTEKDSDFQSIRSSAAYKQLQRDYAPPPPPSQVPLPENFPR